MAMKVVAVMVVVAAAVVVLVVAVYVWYRCGYCDGDMGSYCDGNRTVVVAMILVIAASNVAVVFNVFEKSGTKNVPMMVIYDADTNCDDNHDNDNDFWIINVRNGRLIIHKF
ncbi:hypothetical protein DPMN_127420 [Dreissena polymorpha]|uniref:Transmembrane protein n=1 Tax=Dreissena polymorpha TaxID=45954 RepID=A0A9D4GXL5_DREPO|nr:hypothetical protein DPMN_127420 [Dreissena polymorpha]